MRVYIRSLLITHNRVVVVVIFFTHGLLFFRFMPVTCFLCDVTANTEDRCSVVNTKWFADQGAQSLLTVGLLHYWHRSSLLWVIKELIKLFHINQRTYLPKTSMAASELIQEDDKNCIEVISTDPPSPPQSTKVPNHTHHISRTPHSEDVLDGDGKGRRRKITEVLKENQLINSLCNKIQQRCNYDKITKESDDPLPKEWWKTGVSFIYAFFALVFNAVIIVIIHERVPDKSVIPPLPDKFFDYIDRVPWAFKATEACGLTLCGLWLVQWLALKHR